MSGVVVRWAMKNRDLWIREILDYMQRRFVKIMRFMRQWSQKQLQKSGRINSMLTSLMQLPHRGHSYLDVS